LSHLTLTGDWGCAGICHCLAASTRGTGGSLYISTTRAHSLDPPTQGQFLVNPTHSQAKTRTPFQVSPSTGDCRCAGVCHRQGSFHPQLNSQDGLPQHQPRTQPPAGSSRHLPPLPPTHPICSLTPTGDLGCAGMCHCQGGFKPHAFSPTSLSLLAENPLVCLLYCYRLL
jgi:hypothetical protein